MEDIVDKMTRDLERNIEETIRKYGWNREEVLASLNTPYRPKITAITPQKKTYEKPESRFREYMQLRKMAKLRRKFFRIGHEGPMGRLYKAVKRKVIRHLFY